MGVRATYFCYALFTLQLIAIIFFISDLVPWVGIHSVVLIFLFLNAYFFAPYEFNNEGRVDLNKNRRCWFTPYTLAFLAAFVIAGLHLCVGRYFFLNFPPHDTERAGYAVRQLLEARVDGDREKVQKVVISNPDGNPGYSWDELLQIQQVVRIEDVPLQKTHTLVPLLKAAVVRGEKAHGEPWLKCLLLLQIERERISIRTKYQILFNSNGPFFQYPPDSDLKSIRGALKQVENQSKGWALVPLAALEEKQQDAITDLKKACSLLGNDSRFKDLVNKSTLFQGIINDPANRKELIACGF